MEKKYRIAVASTEGLLVDQHFGHATEFAIYQGNRESMVLTGKRQVGKYCGGEEDCDEEEVRRESILDSFADCDGILVMRIGYSPRQKLKEKGILVLEWPERVKQGLLHLVEEIAKQRRKENE